MIRAKETDSVVPVCPHCEKEVKNILVTAISSTFGKRYAYYCEHCKKIFGVSHRKGFFMG